MCPFMGANSADELLPTTTNKNNNKNKNNNNFYNTTINRGHLCIQKKLFTIFKVHRSYVKVRPYETQR